MSILNPPAKIGVGLGLAAVDAYIFNTHMPSVADVRTAEPQNTDADAARRSATGLCIAINGLASVMAHDWDIFLIGGAVTAGLSWVYAHANTVHPATGTTMAPGESADTTSSTPDAYSMPDYSDDSGS
jgi:hypothetical protein